MAFLFDSIVWMIAGVCPIGNRIEQDWYIIDPAIIVNRICHINLVSSRFIDRSCSLDNLSWHAWIYPSNRDEWSINRLIWSELPLTPLIWCWLPFSFAVWMIQFHLELPSSPQWWINSSRFKSLAGFKCCESSSSQINRQIMVTSVASDDVQDGIHPVGVVDDILTQ